MGESNKMERKYCGICGHSEFHCRCSDAAKERIWAGEPLVFKSDCRRLSYALELLQQIVDDVEAGGNYNLEDWHLVVRTELIDKAQEFLEAEK